MTTMTDQRVSTTANQSKVGATAGLYPCVLHWMYTIDYMTLSWHPGSWMNLFLSCLVMWIANLDKNFDFIFGHTSMSKRVQNGKSKLWPEATSKYFEVGCGFRVDFSFETSILWFYILLLIHLLRPPAAVGDFGFKLWLVLRLKIPFLTSTTIPKPKQAFSTSAPQQFVFWFGFSTMVTSYAWSPVWQMLNVILTFWICQNYPKNSVLVFEFLSILLVFFILLLMFGTITFGSIASMC